MPKTRPSLRFKVSVPPDVAKALRARPKIMRIFQAFPPSHQRRYIDWIREAVKETTRRRRTNEMLARIDKS